MGQNKVYISSTYRDLAEYRFKVLEFFHKKTLQQYFDVVSMEGYVADDTEPRLECIEDVKNCSVYILILAKRYGYIPPDKNINPLQISITELEYNAAVASKKPILAFFCDEKIVFEDDKDEEKKVKLQNFKQNVQSYKMMHPVGFTNSDHLTLQVAESIINRYSLKIEVTERNLDDIIYCDRSVEMEKFDIPFYNSSKLLNFFLINCHAFDMPYKFIDRKELDFKNEERKYISLKIRLASNDYPDTTELEKGFKIAIMKQWNGASFSVGHKFKDIKDVNFEKIQSNLQLLNIECLIITWEIQSIYWKNDMMKNLISELYQRFENLNQEGMERKIVFIGIINYVEGSELSYAQFQDKISTIQYGNGQIKLSMIDKQAIKNWLIDKEIEDNPKLQSAIISEKFSANPEGYYYCDIETPLREILTNIEFIQSK
jgi:hypothetical protein